MAYLPNIQFTFILFVLFITRYTIKESILLMVSYTLIMGILYGFSIFTLFTFMSVIILLITKVKLNVGIVILISLLQMWIYIPISVILYGVSLKAYILSDIPYTFIYIVNNTLIYLWLYKPLERIKKYENYRC